MSDTIDTTTAPSPRGEVGEVEPLKLRMSRKFTFVLNPLPVTVLLFAEIDTEPIEVQLVEEAEFPVPASLQKGIFSKDSVS